MPISWQTSTGGVGSKRPTLWGEARRSLGDCCDGELHERSNVALYECMTSRGRTGDANEILCDVSAPRHPKMLATLRNPGENTFDGGEASRPSANAQMKADRQH